MFVLPTLLVKVYIGKEVVGYHRALLDSGSQPNLINHNVIKRFVANCEHVQGQVVGIGEKSIKITRRVSAYIQPWFEREPLTKIPVKFWILPKSSTWSPILPVRDIGCAELGNNLESPLADPIFWKSEKTSVLLGIAMWPKLMQGNVHNLTGELVAQDSKVGKLIMGTAGKKESEYQPLKSFSIKASSFEQLNQTMKKFWEFEDLPMGLKKDAEQEMAEEILKNRHSRDDKGAFIVEMPLKPTIDDLGSSRAIALKRFLALEKRFRKDEQ